MRFLALYDRKMPLIYKHFQESFYTGNTQDSSDKCGLKSEKMELHVRRADFSFFFLFTVTMIQFNSIYLHCALTVDSVAKQRHRNINSSYKC